RNNAPISNYGGGFRCKCEYPWCIIEVKSKHFPIVFKKIEKNKKKLMEKREILRNTSFRPNRFFHMVTNHCKYLKFSPNIYIQLNFQKTRSIIIGKILSAISRRYLKILPCRLNFLALPKYLQI
ncbi:Uncharacterized protein FWK35_00009523, partial [Aphis craccivora]